MQSAMPPVLNLQGQEERTKEKSIFGRRLTRAIETRKEKKAFYCI